jgi:hypothetical protein
VIRVKLPDGREGLASEWNRYLEVGSDKKERLSVAYATVICDDGAIVVLESSLVEKVPEPKLTRREDSCPHCGNIAEVGHGENGFLIVDFRDEHHWRHVLASTRWYVHSEQGFDDGERTVEKNVLGCQKCRKLFLSSRVRWDGNSGGDNVDEDD